ncbi:Cysteine and glycine-rich protein 1 [Physocladia obscura]|uniref:Cysteine and glycine-rich protein 1 n=1 Tax=Physocladia obscura TaxID=109957 RepID=A0AAD5T0S1_9FUNG|nr:Cysteine and glycine-rich protein 1 [Physocladia obscura]
MDTLITDDQRFFSKKVSSSLSNLTNSQETLQPTNQSNEPQSSQEQQSFSVANSPFKVAAAASASISEAKAKLASPAVAAGGCPRCGKQVYFAEQIFGPGGIKYHKLCFRCTDCGKGLCLTKQQNLV